MTEVPVACHGGRRFIPADILLRSILDAGLALYLRMRSIIKDKQGQWSRRKTMDTQSQSRAVTLKIRGKERIFDIDLPDLPDWIEDAALKSGGFPYDKKLSEKDYAEELTQLQIELVKVQFWMQKTGQRVMALFEGRMPPERAVRSAPPSLT